MIVDFENKWSWGKGVDIICDGYGVLSVDFEDGVRWGYIKGLAVHPSKQRQGLGTRLMEAAEQIIREQGFDEAQLWVEEEHKWQKEWYERLGYKVIMQKDGYFKMRKLL